MQCDSGGTQIVPSRRGIHFNVVAIRGYRGSTDRGIVPRLLIAKARLEAAIVS